VAQEVERDMTTPCPNCARDTARALDATDLNQGLSDAVFTYHRCPSCRLLFLAAVPEDLGRYYGSSYSPYQIPTERDLTARAELERYKLDAVRKVLSGGRLLEVGPGFGAFAHLAQKSGFEVEAIEMDRRCSDFLENALGIRTVTTDRVSSGAQGLRPFDAITAWHVVEHLPDVWEALEALSARLHPGGVLIIATPNPSALQFRFFGRFWAHLDAPRHVQLIPKQLLVDRMASHGLEVVTLTTRDEASRLFQSFGWWVMSFTNVVRACLPAAETSGLDGPGLGPRRALQVTAALLRAFVRSPFRSSKVLFPLLWRAILFSLLMPLERIEGLGAAYTVVFRKRRAADASSPSRGAAEAGGGITHG